MIDLIYRAATKINAETAYYIKLGSGGEWEEECLRDGTLRFGYGEVCHALCLGGDWESVKETMLSVGNGDRGAATRHANQIRAFYEANESTCFVTIVKGCLYWCQPSGAIDLLNDGAKRRGTVDGWHGKSIHGSPLTKNRLSGNLTKVEGFRGTICRIKDFDYLIQKINDELSPEAIEADEAEAAILSSTVKLMRRLTWQDFEQLIDLVFSSSGWRRTGKVGGTQKTVDIELVLPSTNERAFVQVKSYADSSSLRAYTELFKTAVDYDRMFFVWHSGEVLGEMDGVTLIGPDRLARMILDAGAWSWLRNKAC